MHNPPHPGIVARQRYLEPLGFAVPRVAHGQGTARQVLSESMNERTGISAEMAIRLSQAFGSGTQGLEFEWPTICGRFATAPRRSRRSDLRRDLKYLERMPGQPKRALRRGDHEILNSSILDLRNDVFESADAEIFVNASSSPEYAFRNDSRSRRKK